MADRVGVDASHLSVKSVDLPAGVQHQKLDACIREEVGETLLLDVERVRLRSHDLVVKGVRELLEPERVIRVIADEVDFPLLDVPAGFQAAHRWLPFVGRFEILHIVVAGHKDAAVRRKPQLSNQQRDELPRRLEPFFAASVCKVARDDEVFDGLNPQEFAPAEVLERPLKFRFERCLGGEMEIAEVEQSDRLRVRQPLSPALGRRPAWLSLHPRP